MSICETSLEKVFKELDSFSMSLSSSVSHRMESPTTLFASTNTIPYDFPDSTVVLLLVVVTTGPSSTSFAVPGRESISVTDGICNKGPFFSSRFLFLIFFAFAFVFVFCSSLSLCSSSLSSMSDSSSSELLLLSD